MPIITWILIKLIYRNRTGAYILDRIKLMIPVGFLLLALQGVSEIIKRAAFLSGRIPDPLEQHHEPVVEEFLKGAVE